MAPRQNSIVTRVIIALVAATTLLLGAMGFIYYQIERTREHAGIRDRLVANTDQLAASLANPVWSYDDRQIELIIEGMMNDREIYGVIANASGRSHVRLRDAQWKVTVGDREFPAAGLLVEERGITFANKPIGTVKVFAASKFIEEDLGKIRLLIISFILIADLIMTLTLYWIIQHMMLKPLKRIERYAGEVSSAGGTGVMIPGTQFYGELERLRASIETMVRQLEARHAELQVSANELRNSQAFLNNIVEHIPATIFVKDAAKLRYVRFNKTGEELLGYAQGELLGKSDYDLFPKDEADFFTEKDREVLHGGHLVEIPEEAIQTRHRGQRILHTKKIPIFDRHGDAQYLLGISEDITERRRTEEALRDRNRYIETILENAPIGFAVNTIHDGQGVFVGSKFEEIYGVPRGSITTVDEYFEKVYLDPEFREQIRARIMADMATGDAARMRWEDLPITTAAGEKRFVTAINIPLLDQNLMVSTVQDVTARHRAEEARQESEQRFRTLAEATFEGIALSENGVFVDLNDRLAEMMGYERQALLGQPVVTLVAPESREVVEEATRTARQEPYQHAAQRRDGTVFPVEVRARSARIAGRTLRISSVRDITERKQAEIALRRHADELQARNAELTRFNRAATGRELRMIELKQEVNDLCRQTGQPQRYSLEFAETTPRQSP